MPAKYRWQFSPRALFLLMTLLAALIAFVANFPKIALAIVLFAGWMALELGFIEGAIIYLSEPRPRKSPPADPSQDDSAGG